MISKTATEFGLVDLLLEARAYVWAAGVAFTFALIFLVVELLSPDLVIWTGRCVPAFFDGGVAHYRVAGQDFTADTPALSDRRPRTVTVCYYPNDPGTGYIVHPAAYWVEGAVIIGPLGLGVVLVAFGLWRARRRLLNSAQLPPLPAFRHRSD